MKTIILDTTTKSLEVLLGGTVATNQLQFTASYADNTGTVFTEGESDGVTNNATAVTVVAAPASSTRRTIKSWSVYNADTTTAIVTVRVNNNSNYRIIAKYTLDQGDSMTNEGVYNSSGQLKTAATSTFTTSSSDTLTNKTINLANNTLTGTKSQFDTACSDGNFLYTGDIAGGDATNNIGYLNIPQNSQSAAYTTVLADSGKHILHPASDNNARTFTIDSNANVAYPIGTAITFINMINTVTIAITSDTMTLMGAGTTGSRTLAANGMATAIKIGSTSWIISGNGLS